MSRVFNGTTVNKILCNGTELTKVVYNSTVVYEKGGSEPDPGPSLGDAVADYAMQFIGTPYAYGGASPSGFDPSGFTMYCYSKYGVSLPHNARVQASIGTKVPYSEVKRGDLVFLASNGAIGSVGIYVGGGQIIISVPPSSSSSGGVVVKATPANMVQVNRIFT